VFYWGSIGVLLRFIYWGSFGVRLEFY